MDGAFEHYLAKIPTPEESGMNEANLLADQKVGSICQLRQAHADISLREQSLQAQPCPYGVIVHLSWISAHV